MTKGTTFELTPARLQEWMRIWNAMSFETFSSVIYNKSGEDLDLERHGPYLIEKFALWEKNPVKLIYSLDTPRVGRLMAYCQAEEECEQNALE